MQRKIAHPSVVFVARQSWRSDLLVAETHQFVWVRSPVKHAAKEADVLGVLDVVQDGPVLVAVRVRCACVEVEQLDLDVESDALDFRSRHHDVVRLQSSTKKKPNIFKGES